MKETSVRPWWFITSTAWRIGNASRLKIVSPGSNRSCAAPRAGSGIARYLGAGRAANRDEAEVDADVGRVVFLLRELAHGITQGVCLRHLVELPLQTVAACHGRPPPGPD